MSLHAGDAMPMFTVTSSVDGASFAYQHVWQHKHLLLVAVPQADLTRTAYVERLLARADFESDVQLVITTDHVAGIPSPGVVVADRWGEIYFIQGADHASGLPTADDLVEWVRFVQIQCPECQGETR